MINVLDLLNKTGITPRLISATKGGEYHSACPTCNGEDRFHVWPAQNNGNGSWWCRGCQGGGDNIQFLINFEGKTFLEAKRLLGLPNDDQEYGRIPRRRQVAPAKPVWSPENKNFPSEVVNPGQWQEHAEKFVDHCHQQLLDNQKTMQWLANRGISEESVRKYRLGLNDKTTFRPRESWGMKGGINPNTKRPSMLILPAGVVIPWFGQKSLHRLRIRLATPDPQNPKKKYHAVAGSAMDTFLTTETAMTYVVVETELDAIMLDSVAGDLVGVGAMGSSHAKPTSRAAVIMKAADRVLNALDNDKAGESASVWWQDNFKNCRRYAVALGGDPGEAYEKGVNIREWLKKGLPYSQKINSLADLLSLPANMPVKEKVKKVVPVKSPTVLVSSAAEVEKMAELLAVCPVFIKNTKYDQSIWPMKNYNRDKHWNLKAEISQLLFFSDPVIEYLAAHPAEAISASNFIRR